MSSNYAHFLKHPVFKVVSKYATENNIQAFVIGGYVRDLFLERNSKDIDIVIVGDGPSFAQAIASIMRIKKISIFKNYGTAHFKYKVPNYHLWIVEAQEYNANNNIFFLTLYSISGNNRVFNDILKVQNDWLVRCNPSFFLKNVAIVFRKKAKRKTIVFSIFF